MKCVHFEITKINVVKCKSRSKVARIEEIALKVQEILKSPYHQFDLSLTHYFCDKYNLSAHPRVCDALAEMSELHANAFEPPSRSRASPLARTRGMRAGLLARACSILNFIIIPSVRECEKQSSANSRKHSLYQCQPANA